MNINISNDYFSCYNMIPCLFSRICC